MTSRLRHVLRALHQWPAFYFVVVLLGLVELGWLVPAIAIHALVPPARSKRMGRKVISFVFRQYFRLTRICGVLVVDADAVDAIDPDEALVIAPNHPSGLDALILISRLENLNCIMKASMLDNVFLGAGSRLAGYIRNDGPRRMFRLSTEELKAGGQLIIFPEATRTLSAPMNAFKGGFVAMAKAARVPIQTVIVETDTPFLSKGWSVLRKPPRMPMHYRVRLGKRFEIAPDADLNASVAALRAHFVEELRGAELGDLWTKARPPAVDMPATEPRIDPCIDPAHGVPSMTTSRWG